MNVGYNSELKKQIDKIQWYHEFNFPDGLKARSMTADTSEHRKLWSFIESQLDLIEFKNKTVLDIGCWDGFWSFYAEKRGAKHVLATDDKTQNWAGAEGLKLAHQLYHSSVEIRDDVSIYKVKELGQTFDIILCLGVYYHLVDPFHAFAQVRHCCHEQTIVIFEGDISHQMKPNNVHIDLTNPHKQTFVPSQYILNQMLGAAYFEVVSQIGMYGGRRNKLKHKLMQFRGKISELIGAMLPWTGTTPHLLDRVVSICQPFKGKNPFHAYRPPFQLEKYDDRFC